MCGIYCEITSSAEQCDCHHRSLLLKKSKIYNDLQRRGPDCSALIVKAINSSHLECAESVSHHDPVRTCTSDVSQHSKPTGEQRVDSLIDTFCYHEPISIEYSNGLSNRRPIRGQGRENHRDSDTGTHAKPIGEQHSDGVCHCEPIGEHGSSRAPGLCALFSGHVLHHQGPLTVQPLQDPTGNILLWNGEVFSGLTVHPNENDGRVLLASLESCHDDRDILATLSSVRGPWSLIYWQEKRQCLWFGRDCFGRRSLLWSFPAQNHTTFQLSSVANRQEANSRQTWSEVPTDGIYCLDAERWSVNLEEPTPIQLFPWQRAGKDSDADTSYHGIGSRSHVAAMALPNGISYDSNPEKLARGSNPSYALTKSELSIRNPISLLNVSLPSDGQARMVPLWAEFNKPRLLASASWESGRDSAGSSADCRDGTDEQVETLRIDRLGVGQELCRQETNNKGVLRATASTGDVGQRSHTETTAETVRFPADEPAKPLPRKATELGLAPGESSSSSSLLSAVDCELTAAARGLIGTLQESVRRRVFNLQRDPPPAALPGCTPPETEQQDECGTCMCQRAEVTVAVGESGNSEGEGGNSSGRRSRGGLDRCWNGARVAVLFSGGVDSMVIAVLADRSLPQEEPVDLINVAFEQSAHSSKSAGSISLSSYDVPDRLTGRAGLEELRKLNPSRQWNFVEVNVSFEELQLMRRGKVSDLIYPLRSVMDDSIGCAIWFATRGRGLLKNPHPVGSAQVYQTKAKVVLVGMGADEQLAGYSRHRTVFKSSGWSGLVDEINMEIRRISTRNLARDDRVISDHGREARFPFLDEDVVNYLNDIPIWLKADLTLPRGIGEKLLLRVAARILGLTASATLPKRAIQFGSRIARLENSKEKAAQLCNRLLE